MKRRQLKNLKSDCLTRVHFAPPMSRDIALHASTDTGDYLNVSTNFSKLQLWSLYKTYSGSERHPGVKYCFTELHTDSNQRAEDFIFNNGDCVRQN